MADPARTQIESWLKQGDALPVVDPALRQRVLAAARQRLNSHPRQPVPVAATQTDWELGDVPKSPTQRFWNRILVASLLVGIGGLITLTCQALHTISFRTPAVIAALRPSENANDESARPTGINEWNVVEYLANDREQRRKSVFGVLTPTLNEW